MIEGIKKIRQAFARITKRLGKEKTEKREDENTKEIPEKEVVFGDGEQPITIPAIITRKEKTSDGWLVYAIRGETLPKVVEVKICKSKRETRRRKRKLHNAGNNKRKMNGQTLKRFIAKQKVRKERCPNRTQ
nr:MAG TPA: hypothetical protein [Caudoviricetes sp.]